MPTYMHTYNICISWCMKDQNILWEAALAYCCDYGLRICSPLFNVHHCCCSFEQGTLLPLLQSAVQTVRLLQLLYVVVLVTFPRGTPKALWKKYESKPCIIDISLKQLLD